MLHTVNLDGATSSLSVHGAWSSSVSEARASNRRFVFDERRWFYHRPIPSELGIDNHDVPAN